MKRFLIVITCCVFFCIAHAQNVPIGSWEIHSPYNEGIGAVEHNNHMYFLGKNGLFKRNIDNNENTKLSKIDGLSDHGFSALGYHNSSGTIIIGYQNGNVDLIKDNAIINIASIKKAQNILGSKKINDIQEYQDYVFLSTDFGVVKIDVIKESIKETYKNITVEGNILKVNESLIFTKNDEFVSNDTIFLATDVGVMAANLTSTNLIDYNQWLLYDSTHNISEETAYHLCEYKNSVYVISGAEGIKLKTTILKKVNEKWENHSLPDVLPWYSIKDIYNLFVHKDIFYIGSKKGIWSMTEDAKLIEKFDSEKYTHPKYLISDSKDQTYLVDLSEGFLKLDDDWNFFSPNGPYFSDIFNFEIINNTLYGLSGGFYSNSLQPNQSSKGYYVYINHKWETIINKWEKANDIVDVAIHKNRNEMYFASYSHGLLMLKDNEYTLFQDSMLITTSNPPFQSPLTYAWPRVRITTVETDNNGLTWFTNYLSNGNPSLFRINNDGTWTSFNINNRSADYISQLIFDKNNNIWALANGSEEDNGLFSLTLEGEFVSFIPYTKLPSNPNTIAVDNENNIWIGTNTGIGIISDPDDLNNITITKPIVSGRYLLEEEVVKTISVDGANRKWIGTSNGLYLYNADGTEQLAYFNTENSPLLSNRVQTTKIHPETGELFIGTDYGILSYRTGSTKGESECDEQIKVFPNPVTPEFNGYVGLEGVAENSIVKITDVSGKLVYETTALGGQAIWNVKDLKQNKVKTGIYLAYISTVDGEASCVTKIAVIE